MATGGIQNTLTLILTLDAGDDATSNLSYICTRAFTVTDVKVMCTDTNAGGTLQVGKWSGVFNDVSQVLACDTDRVITRASTMQYINADFVAGEAIAIRANAVGDAGVVTVECIAPQAGATSLFVLP